LSPQTVTLRMLREAIGVALRDAMSSDAVEEFCTGLGLAPPQHPEDIAFISKRAYVVRRLGGKTQPELVEVALRVLDECDGDSASARDLAELVGGLGASGVPGEMKNLIFASSLEHRLPEAWHRTERYPTTASEPTAAN
jgi:hypothetical protein